MAGWAANALTAAQLSDGRIQFWTTDAAGQMYSTWQNSFDWVYWQHQWTPVLPPFAATNLTVAPLSDKRLQFWAVDTAGAIWSCWKSTTSSTAAWTAWTKTWTPNAPTFSAKQVAAAPLSDGRLQFWAVDTTGAIWSCWKSSTSSSAAWTAWTKTWTPSAPTFTAKQVTAAPLSDGRLQFWAVDTTGAIWSCWKSSTSSSAAWTAWTKTWTPSAPTFTANQVTAAPLSDNRLQFWALDSSGKLWSCWKSSTSSTSSWTAWTKSWTADVPAFNTRAMWPARMSDGRLALWAIDTTGLLWATVKSTTSSSAAWQNWSLQFEMQQQEQTNWCWAGCAAGTSFLYDRNSAWSQCKVANCELASTTCCSNPGPCNVYGYLDVALTCVGHYQSFLAGTVPDATLTSETAAGRPVGVRQAWSGGGAHFIMINGGGPNNMVTVKDPWYGSSYIPYATLVNGYQGTGSWTHTYYTN